ncbi:MAG: molybdopterin molybdotransferase MoeA [Proteobacteria bacterium]|jgi:molybdopterin molybdotransferase|nr:molybdopterin molybdotransferase MoeA [Pseudomonadota bacterium]MDA1299831.1 molybdopterin molybdotransferase MoeA [Pseudomonadota bacterium]
MTRAPLHPVDEVVQRLLDEAVLIPETTTLVLDEALGKYLAGDVTSGINVPPVANSAMDGYAFDRNDPGVIAGGLIEVSDRIPAGSVGGRLVPGTIARIFTGAPIPEGANTVVMQEDTRAEEGRVRILELPPMSDNVRPAGQDIKAGTVILDAGRRLCAADLALAASVGHGQLTVRRPLRVAVMSTGDELVEPPAQLAPGQIYNANRYVLAGLLRGLGMEVVDLGIVADTLQATEAALARGAAECDCIISTGGVSVGEEDYVRDAIETLGELTLWRLAIKPGKPLAYGHVKGTPFFGLPGNPVSTYVTFKVIAAPYLIATQGGNQPVDPGLMARADFNFSAGSRREYLRVRVRSDEQGETWLTKFPNQGSGIMSSVSWADALAVAEVGQTIRRGDRLRYFAR